MGEGGLSISWFIHRLWMHWTSSFRYCVRKIVLVHKKKKKGHAEITNWVLTSTSSRSLIRCFLAVVECIYCFNIFVEVRNTGLWCRQFQFHVKNVRKFQFSLSCRHLSQHFYMNCMVCILLLSLLKCWAVSWHLAFFFLLQLHFQQVKWLPCG